MSNVDTVVDRLRLKAIADCWRNEFSATRVLLFGSAARDEATEHSDINLLVIAPTKEKFYERMGSALAVVRDMSIGLPLSLLVLTPDELSARLALGDQFIQEIIETGVEL